MDLNILRRLNAAKLARAQEKLDDLRQQGRPQGQFLEKVGRAALKAGHEWPVVMEDHELRTTTVPATFEGLLAFVASWDSLLLDDEIETLREVVEKMVPMGLIYQATEKRRREQERQHLAHIKANEPERWERMQGWKV